MGIFNKIWDVATDVGHMVTGIPTAQEKRAAKGMMDEQIKAYKEQTALTRSEIERKRGEEKAEKRRVEEKQIRQIKRGYRSSSMLGSTNSTEPDMNQKLGG